ncbi:MAG: hypothetical protein KatS3mg129_3214 [Leptospiraceae bacterium]|nr:MAG: hypothetical protein KatS3mg129_3136 [Leptospiraceae bacterium]GIX43481.1 MAG: hypothetical protein KatS3mg129_3214 [Leptospiraceae bacterium]
MFLLGSFFLNACTTQKDNQYSIEEANIKLLSMVILKNSECNTNKQMELIYFPIDKKQIDLCFYEVYFLDCNKWNNNLLPESCKFLNIQLK